MAQKTREEKLAQECIEKAQNMMGAGWDHISVEVQFGLVCANILGIQLIQDESIDPAKVLARTETIHNICRRLVVGDCF